jgi:toxin ParE1/3/4
VKPVLFHAEAERELREAIAYYEAQRKGLGREFRSDLESSLGRMRQSPGTFPLHDDHETRKVLVRRFPYTLFFVELDESLWVAAVAHHKRLPVYWAARRPE